MKIYSESEKLYKDITHDMFVLDPKNGISINALAGCITELIPQISTSKIEPEMSNYNRTPTHMHDYYQLFFVSASSAMHRQTVEEKELLLPVGSLILIPPHVSHRTHPQSGTCGEILQFSQEFLNSSRTPGVRELFLNWGYILPWLKKGDVGALKILTQENERMNFQRQAENIGEIFDNKIRTVFLKRSSPLNQVYGEEICAAFDRFASDIGRKFYAARTQKELAAFEKYNPPLLAAIDYIYEHMNERISVKDLVGVTGFKTAWLSKLFERIMHVPIVEFINFTRMQKARMLLINTERSISDIAAECGFNSAIYFDRVFKYHTGCQPKEYRREYLLEWED